MRSRSTHWLAAAAGLFGGLSLFAMAAAQPAAPQPPHNTCFYSTQFQNWKAPDPRTIFIRVNMNRYFRLDLSGECPELVWPDSHLITHVRGSDSICSALDWDLKVSQGINGIPEACIVKTMTELTPAQAAAIPPKFRP
jgi:hypothetical protein